MKLSTDEWKSVGNLLDLLEVRAESNRAQQFSIQYAEEAQHVFSSDNRPLLHKAIPALERLHSKWNKRIDDPEYFEFEDALREAALKVRSTMTKLPTATL